MKGDWKKECGSGVNAAQAQVPFLKREVAARPLAVVIERAATPHTADVESASTSEEYWP